MAYVHYSAPSFIKLIIDILDFKVESLLQIKQVMLSAEEAALMLGHQVILASSEYKYLLSNICQKYLGFLASSEAEYLSPNICQKYLLS